MKIASLPKTSLVSGATDSTRMGMSEIGIQMAIKMFRDQIYSNKPWAIVRELLANAVDEHRRHNVQDPIVITLPTDADPHLRIRDHAKGLPKEGVFEHFFQYFASTKSNSNDDMGGFGIGAKSPLAYADNFFVASYHNGSSTLYAAVKDGNDSDAHQISSRPTSETGLEVAVPIERGDFQLFEKYVQHFLICGKYDNYQLMKVNANNEIEEFEFSSDNPCTQMGELICEVDEIEIRRGMRLYTGQSNTGIYVRDGEIIYPVGHHSRVTNVSSSPVIINVKRGAVDLPPSRETINLTNRSLATIEEAMKRLKNTVKARIEADLDKAKSATEKLELLRVSNNFSLGNNDLFYGLTYNMRAQKIFAITWSDSLYARINSRRGLTDSRYRSDLSLDPSKSNILVYNGEKPRYNQIIAFCESVGIKDKVYCVHRDSFIINYASGKSSDKFPSSWVEGIDYFEYEEPSKDASKAVRKRYASSSSVVSNSGKWGKVVGRVKPSKSWYDAVEIDMVPDNALFVPADDEKLQLQIKEAKALLGESWAPIFYYDIDAKRAAANDYDPPMGADWLADNKAKIEAEAKTRYRDLEDKYKETYLLLVMGKTNFPSKMFPRTVLTSQDWGKHLMPHPMTELMKKIDKLSAEDRELIQCLKLHHERYNHIHLPALAKKAVDMVNDLMSK